ncbi:MAG: peptidoglycan-binding protein [Richelia sp.]|nr:peptidoglycan-binding protein [Richelia sp.]
MAHQNLTSPSTPLIKRITTKYRHKSNTVSRTLKFMLITVAFASTPWESAFAQQVRLGESGANVNYIQRCLQRLGHFQGNITGYFGIKTENALRSFQQAVGIDAIGVLGPITRQALQRRCSNHSSNNQQTNNSSNLLQIGSSGSAVTQLQRDLQSLGFYRSSITGTFQYKTFTAVQQFQQSRRLRMDGIVGRRTQREIQRAMNENASQTPLPMPENSGTRDPFPNALNQGDAGSRVSELQRALQRLRYFNHRITGIFGNRTRDAVLRFQQDNKLIPNGIANSQTIAAISQALDRLFSSCTPKKGDICLGENSQRVTAVQKQLQERGFLGGNPTGYFDRATSTAVDQFQRTVGITPTGFVDTRTFQALAINNNSRSSYVVVVPLRDDETLTKVRQLLPQAFQAESRLGTYVNAGNFSVRSDAEKVTRMLRSEGFDARVEFF